MNLLTKTTPYGDTSGGMELTVVDHGELGVRVGYIANVRDGADRFHHLSHDLWIRSDDLVEVHAALGRAIDARLHAEASKSVNPKE